MLETLLLLLVQVCYKLSDRVLGNLQKLPRLLVVMYPQHKAATITPLMTQVRRRNASVVSKAVDPIGAPATNRLVYTAKSGAELKRSGSCIP